MREKVLFNNLISDEWLTHKEASQYLRTTEGELYNKVSRGEVPLHKLGRRNLYERSVLREILLSSRQGGYAYDDKRTRER